MSPRARLFALSLAPILYVAIAQVQASGGQPSSLAAAILLPFVLLGVFHVTEPKTVGEDLVGTAPRAALRLASVGAALYVAARSGVVGRPAFDAAASVGVGLATSAALVGLARVPEVRGLLRAPASSRRLDPALAMVLLATIATTVPAVAALSPRRGNAIDPLAIDYALVAEGASALVLLLIAALRARVARRLELGVVDRFSAAFVLATTALAVAAPASFLRFAPPDRVLPMAALISALATTITLLVPDPTMVGRALRTLLIVSILGTPIALFTAGVAAAAPKHAGATVLVASIGLVLVGVLARRVSARMTPDAARWLSALSKAQESATIPEPHSALQATLSTLRERLGETAPSPVLFRLEAGDQLTVDRAGYLHESPGTAPRELFAYCDAEPQQTFRLEVARALEVRSPDVRPSLAWMEAHGFATVTSLRDEAGPVGLLAIPRGKRRAPLTLEEAIALGKLTDRVTSVFALSSSLASAHKRQLDAEEALGAARNDADSLRAQLSRDGERHAAFARRLARSRPISRYSPSARLVEAELSRAGLREAAIVLLAPPGVAAEGFAASAHLEGPRRAFPFVVADGADAREHPIAHWTDPASSPLHLARGGTLLLLDAPALPEETQQLFARVLRDKQMPDGETIDVRVILVVRETIDALVARGRLREDLADAVGDRVVPLPPLIARGEDIRSLAMDLLARIGNAYRGEALGLDDGALALLLEHNWPGNDDELALTLLTAAQATSGAVLTAADLEAIGFPHAAPASAQSVTSRRRRG